MFGLSTWEVLIILVVALIFIGPDQLPKVARQIGKGVRQIRGAMGKVDTEMRRAVRRAEAELERDEEGDEGKPAPPAAGTARTPSVIERDWSKVGTTPPAGRVANANPARPGAPATPPTEPPPPSESPAGAPDDATSEETPTPSSQEPPTT